MPARRDHNAIYNWLVLATAVVTLTIFAAVATVPRLFNSVDPVAERFDQTAFIREIDRAIAEGPSLEPNLPLFIVEAVPAKVETEVTIAPDPSIVARAQARTAAVAAAVATAMATAVASPRELTRQLQRSSNAGRSDGLEAMAKVSGSDLIAEARKYLGRNPTGWADAWCGKFLDMILKKTGRPGGGNSARGYIKYGKRLPGPQVGAIAVFSRKGGGHVGIVTGIDSNGNPIIISGNHNDRVAIAAYPASRALAYVSAD